MFEENPQITLEEEAHLQPAEGGEGGFYHWAFCLSVYGDDGKQYWLDTNIASYSSLGTFAAVPFGAIDMWTLAVRAETGKVVQIPGSIYKLADFPQADTMAWHPFDKGALKVKRTANKVTVDLEGYHLECNKDLSWHAIIEDKKQGIKADFTHYGIGFPFWYGKTKPQAFTAHTVNYGYFFSGTVEGTFTFEGRKVRVKGKGARERYYSMDVCPAEVGGWHDWIWWHFDECFGALDEMKYSKFKDGALYLVDEKQFFPVRTFNIEHHDWAYLPTLGCFIPTLYKVTYETEAGVLEFSANTVGYKHMAHTSEVPDVPFATLDWDKLDGTFTYKNGRKRNLTNGMGGDQIQQWKPYPAIFTPESIGQGAAMPVVLPKSG